MGVDGDTENALITGVVCTPSNLSNESVEKLQIEVLNWDTTSGLSKHLFGEEIFDESNSQEDVVREFMNGKRGELYDYETTSRPPVNISLVPVEGGYVPACPHYRDNSVYKGLNGTCALVDTVKLDNGDRASVLCHNRITLTK